MGRVAIAFIVMACLCMPALSHAAVNRTRSHLERPVTITDTRLSRSIGDGADGQESLSVEVRAALARAKERAGMSKTRWGVALSSPGDTLSVCLHFGNTDFGDMLDRRIAVVSVTRNGKELYRNEAEGFRMSGGDMNTLSMTLAGGMLGITGGGAKIGEVAEVPVGSPFMPTEAHVWSEGELLVSVFSTEVCVPASQVLGSGHSIESLKERIDSSNDPLEGFWSYFDRENDPMYARPGGRYTLAVVRSGDAEGCYDIVYVDGAKTLGDRWRPMMLKGSLRPTIFEGHYDMTWIDSTFERISEDIHATLDPPGLLTLSFPLLKTTIRFSKMTLK